MNKKQLISMLFSLTLVVVIAMNAYSGGLIDKEMRKPAPDFTFKDAAGKDVSLSDLKGKVIYLDLWGSWCKPCLKEMKYSKELREKIGDNEDMVFLYVAVLEPSKEKWERAVERFDVEGISLISNDPEGTDFRNFYDRGEVPWYYLIDKEGLIADIKAKRPSEDGIVSDINSLLSE